MTNSEDAPRAKRTDVGYKRPPAEHRFKRGQKPPPRKKKSKDKPGPRELLWNILQEPRRVAVDGKMSWMSPAEIIVKNAFLLAEKGNATLRRMVSELLLTLDGEGDSPEPEVIVDPNWGHPDHSY